MTVRQFSHSDGLSVGEAQQMKLEKLTSGWRDLETADKLKLLMRGMDYIRVAKHVDPALAKFVEVGVATMCATDPELSKLRKGGLYDLGTKSGFHEDCNCDNCKRARGELDSEGNCDE